MLRLKPLSEAEFSQQVIDFAHLNHWLVAHFRPAMTGRKDRNGKPIWVTPVQADGKGFPDLVLVRDRVLFAELKVGSNRLTVEQLSWESLLLLAGAELHIWRPEDWPTIERVLSSERRLLP